MATQSNTTPNAASLQKQSTQQIQTLSKQRKVELDKYFHGLKALEDYTSKKITHLPSAVLSDNFMKIIKASTFLLLYNYIEGCVIDAFQGIYTEIKKSKIPYEELRIEFQKIWIEYKTKELLIDKTASHEKYTILAKQIADEVIEKQYIELTRKALPFSGNLDERKIKSVCDLHGIKLSSKVANVESDLKIVVDKRNELAHGSISFAECGRDYIVEDLERIKDNALKYIDIFLSGMETFISSKRYVNTNRTTNP